MEIPNSKTNLPKQTILKILSDINIHEGHHLAKIIKIILDHSKYRFMKVYFCEIQFQCQNLKWKIIFVFLFFLKKRKT